MLAEGRVKSSLACECRYGGGPKERQINSGQPPKPSAPRDKTPPENTGQNPWKINAARPLLGAWFNPCG